MLRLNEIDERLFKQADKNSNTTNVKVKCVISAIVTLIYENSNTTNVKVKFPIISVLVLMWTHSNTTNVKVK